MYDVIRRFLRWALPKYFRWQSFGVEHFPSDGPAIVVSNHANYLDPLAMGAVSPRKLHFMAKDELFSNRLAGWFLRRLGAFPVRRGRADRQAIRHSLRLLEKGQVLAIFPEGTRSKTGELLQLQGGAALLALKSGAPVVPMVIQGAYEALAGGRFIPRRGEAVTVWVGPPLQFEIPERVDHAAVAAASRRIYEALGALYDERNVSGDG